MKPNVFPGGVRPPSGSAPLYAALGEALRTAAPAVRDHFLQSDGTRRYRGVLRVWRRGGLRGLLARPVLWLCLRTRTFFAGAGDNVPFDMTHTVVPTAAGPATMSWVRTLHFPAGPCVYEGAVTFDPVRGVLVERLGPAQRLEAELHCTIEQGELHTTSARQWLRVGRTRLRIPPLLAGRARLREWQREDGTLGTVLTVHNPLLGDFLGWEGWFEPAPDAAAPLEATTAGSRDPT